MDTFNYDASASTPSLFGDLTGRPLFLCHADIMDLKLEHVRGISHYYTFDIGFPPECLRKLAHLFNDNPDARYICSYTSSLKWHQDYGLEADEITEAKLTVKMRGPKTCGAKIAKYFRKRSHINGKSPMPERDYLLNHIEKSPVPPTPTYPAFSQLIYEIASDFIVKSDTLQQNDRRF